jgi:Rad3-related DNA helicase
VGVGLPQICLERNLIRNYYDDRDAAGFAYAYTFPGMNRVLQAAGRVIRSSDDRGLVLLIDRRFGQETYRELFPAHWEKPSITRSPTEIGQAVAAFWTAQQ